MVKRVSDRTMYDKIVYNGKKRDRKIERDREKERMRKLERER